MFESKNQFWSDWESVFHFVCIFYYFSPVIEFTSLLQLFEWEVDENKNSPLI